MSLSLALLAAEPTVYFREQFEDGGNVCFYIYTMIQ